MIDKSQRLGPVMFVISVFGSLLLICVGTLFVFNHSLATESYGVPLSGGPDNSWISSAALRDVAFGCLALTFALLHDRRAVGLSLLFGAIIPIGDAFIVLRDSATPLTYLPFHLGGAVCSLVLAAVLLSPFKRRPTMAVTKV